MELNKHDARNIIETLGSAGIPPERHFDIFTVGLNNYLNTIKEEYVSSFIKDGGSAFKLVVGNYGNGKTHFLYSIRKLAWDEKYIASYISLSPTDTPFSKIEAVYKAIVRTISYSFDEKGIDNLIRAWYGEIIEGMNKKGLGESQLTESVREYLKGLNIENNSFKNALKEAFKALHEDRDEDFEIIKQWLHGENPPKNKLSMFNIFEKIDKTTAFRMLRSLIQWVRYIGYSGLFILFDEAEQVTSLSSKDKKILLSNLRQIIDATANGDFNNTMIFYAVPDDQFLEGRDNFYVALKDRLSTIFEPTENYSGIRIDLEGITKDPHKMLTEIGQKLYSIYEIAYGTKLQKPLCDKAIDSIAKISIDERFGDEGYKRLFVKRMVEKLHKISATGQEVSVEDIKRIR